ncbi:MAG TPA: hypothetical protein VJY54_06385 [Lachnospiraceae bacterium]|nr:hypothetical protein [Lachnospiraceae bacterium]
MREQEWKDTLKEEMNVVHAPDKLIELTKQKVADEEHKLESIRSKKLRISYWINGYTAVAAIFVLFIILSSFIDNRIDLKQQEGTKILLGTNNGQEFYLNEQVEIEHTAVLPVEFAQKDIWEEEIEDTKVLFCRTDEGYYLATYEEEDAYVIVRSKEKDKEKMKLIIVNILNK